MNNLIKIIECPRDAWQALPVKIPAEVKANYLRKLASAGFTQIDAVSFVSPAAVPQMADAEKVLEYLDAPEDLEVIGIVVNAKGAERAIRTGAVRTLGFPYSISPEFLMRNQHQTQAESLRVLESIAASARGAGLGLVTYLSMAFGNPYEDEWSIEDVMDACELLSESGVRQISLADTVGLANPAQIAETMAAVMESQHSIEIGVHLHARPDQAAAKIAAAYHAGCRRFDSAIGGMGGCPFAQDALVGNIPTEILVAELKELGAELPMFQPLDELIQESALIAQRYGA